MQSLPQLRNELFKEASKAEGETFLAMRSKWLQLLKSSLNRLDQLERIISSSVSRGIAPRVAVQLEAERLRSFVRDYSAGLASFASDSVELTQQLTKRLAVMGDSHSQSLLENSATAAGFSGDFNKINPAAIEALTAGFKSDQIRGHFDKLAANGAQQVNQLVESNLMAGWAPKAIKADLTKALGVPSWQAERIARNESVGAYRAAGMANLRANSEYLEGWVWLASLSPRTCAACLAMHGTRHSLDEDFASHVQCRCSPAPIVAGDSRQFQSGDEWLRSQSITVQRGTLGKRGQAMFNDGRPLKDWVHESENAVWGLQKTARTPMAA